MKSGKKRNSDTEDFQLAMTGVQPLKPGNRLEQRPPKPAAIPVQRQRDEQSVLGELLQDVDDPADLETGEELLFLRTGYSPRLLRRLRRGNFSVVDTIDLHHLNQITARDVLLRFLANAEQRGYGCVRVVHGKGLRSRGAPKLKLLTQSVLRRHPIVIAFASCRPVHGGTGAVDVLIKAKRLQTP